MEGIRCSLKSIPFSCNVCLYQLITGQLRDNQFCKLIKLAELVRISCYQWITTKPGKKYFLVIVAGKNLRQNYLLFRYGCCSVFFNKLDALSVGNTFFKNRTTERIVLIGRSSLLQMFRWELSHSSLQEQGLLFKQDKWRAH